jgi:hypothetical protein
MGGGNGGPPRESEENSRVDCFIFSISSISSFTFGRDDEDDDEDDDEGGDRDGGGGGCGARGGGSGAPLKIDFRGGGARGAEAADAK